MASVSDWKVPASAQPKPEDYAYDLDLRLERRGGVARDGSRRCVHRRDARHRARRQRRAHPRNGLVLTIGYLITEAETIWLTLSDGRAVPGHVLGYDQETGFGLVQALAKLDLPALQLGKSAAASVGERVVVGGAGGRQRSVAGAHRRQAGIRRLLGIRARRGDLHRAGASELGRHRADRPRRRPARHRLAAAAAAVEKGQTQNINMIVPIDLLKPILDDLMKFGRRNTPPRPWLGLYATEVENRLVVVGLADRGPAKRADLRTGDIVLAVAGSEVRDLAGLFRRIWAQGEAGVEVPLTIYRDGHTMELRVKVGRAQPLPQGAESALTKTLRVRERARRSK